MNTRRLREIAPLAIPPKQIQVHDSHENASRPSHRACRCAPRSLNRIACLLVTLCALLVQWPGLAAPGDVDSGFDPNANRESYGIAIQPNGKIILGGYFSNIGGVTRNRAARLAIDGSVDGEFNPNVSTGPLDQAFSTALQADGKVMLGGYFTTVGGVVRRSMARLNADGTLDSGFTPNIGGGSFPNIFCMAIQVDGKIVIAGDFTTVNSVNRNLIARLNTDGSLDTGFLPNVTGNYILSLALQTDGKIVIGGGFFTVGGVARNGIARLNGNGTLDTGFDPGTGADDSVNCVAVQSDGRILIAGIFRTLNGVTRNRIARLNANGTLDTGFNPSVITLFNPQLAASVESMVIQADGKTVITGNFTNVGGVVRNYIARLNSEGTCDVGFNSPNPNAYPYGMALQADGKIIIGGGFTAMGGFARNHIGRLENGDATQSLTVPSASRAQWLRGGTSPEAQDVSFDLSTNGGSIWTPLGSGTRINGGWERTGLNLAGSGTIRARARIVGGRYNGSSGIVERLQAFDFAPPTLSPVTISSNNPNPHFAKLGDTITLSFSASERIQTPMVTIADQGTTRTNPSGNNWQGTLAIGAPAVEGPAAFAITATDLAGNAAAAVTATTNGSSVTIDRTPPTLTLLGANPLIVQIATVYVEPGATASDVQAGNLTASVQISGVVDTNRIGTYMRTYVVADNAGNTATATRTVRVVDVPIAGTDTLGTMKNTPVSAPAAKLLANDSDPNGHPLSVVSVASASTSGGSIVLNGGLLTYTPPAGFIGLDSFTYRISDGLGGTATGVVNVTVSGPDGASLNLVSMARTADGFLVGFAGIPGDSYLIQFTNSLTPPVAWTTLTPPGPIQAGPNGLFQFEDKPNPIPPQRFYRAAIPQ